MVKPHHQTDKVCYNCVTGEGLENLDLDRLASAALVHARKNKYIKASLRELYIGFIKDYPCGNCEDD